MRSPRPRALASRALSLSLFLGCALLVSSGCGGSSHSAGPSTGGGAGTPGGGTTVGTNGYTLGVITGFGSIKMGSGSNLKTFDVSSARLSRLDDGVSHSGTDDASVVFRQGMKVEVYHHSDSLRAVEVQYMHDLKGPITAKPGAAGATFDVLGVPVLVDGNTHFDDSFNGSGLSQGSLAVGNVIEISGEYDANGVLHATFIEGVDVSPAGRTFEIKGNLTNLQGVAPNQTFKVNGASFTMDANTRLRDLPVTGLSEGLFVEVKTQSTSAPFLVTRIEGMFGDFDSPENEIRGADKVSVEGFVKNLSGSSPNYVFFIGNTRVTTNASTTGVNLVAPNAHIEAEGGVGADGTINAIKIGARP